MTVLGDDTAAPDLGADTGTGADTVTGADTMGGDSIKGDVVPEKYDFKLPEGITADAAMLTEFEGVAKELKLGQEGAQKLVDIYTKAMDGAVKANAAAYDKVVTGWLDAAKADKEFGGAAFDANIGLARKAIDKFGGPGFINMLNETGAGNHPEVIRLLVKVGKTISEDGINPGGSPSGTTEKTVAQRLYPNLA